MTFRTRSAHCIMAAIAACITTFMTAQTSFAQLTFTDPKCGTVTVVNTSATCNAQVDLVTVPPGVWPAFNLPAGTSALLTVPSGSSVQVSGLIDINGNTLPFVSPQQATFDCGGQNSWSIFGASLTPLASCRFNVCGDPDACTITLQ